MKQDRHLHIRIDEQLERAIGTAAEKTDTPVARWVKAAIREKIARESAGKKPVGNNRVHKC